MTWSKLKPVDKFLRMWTTHGLDGSDIVHEHPLANTNYRFDFAWPSCKVAVEIHGFGFGHQAISGLARDCQKMREAIMQGWVVMPFTTRCISSRANCQIAVYQVNDVICSRHPGGQHDVSHITQGR